MKPVREVAGGSAWCLMMARQMGKTRAPSSVMKKLMLNDTSEESLLRQQQKFFETKVLFLPACLPAV